eukprot:TRINITY_DN23901_c0_g2_i1.p1 TRINITY_DN23901_c0_g2~~TRINITY_DN23901_c0_g2_i1.p1  ORF type:complete len:233 (+),score=47.31 TRINITY_DN23901_c0_g2_i1:67-699(+)
MEERAAQQPYARARESCSSQAVMEETSAVKLRRGTELIAEGFVALAREFSSSTFEAQEQPWHRWTLCALSVVAHSLFMGALVGLQGGPHDAFLCMCLCLTCTAFSAGLLDATFRLRPQHFRWAMQVVMASAPLFLLFSCLGGRVSFGDAHLAILDGFLSLLAMLVAISGGARQALEAARKAGAEAEREKVGVRLLPAAAEPAPTPSSSPV